MRPIFCLITAFDDCKHSASCSRRIMGDSWDHLGAGALRGSYRMPYSRGPGRNLLRHQSAACRAPSEGSTRGPGRHLNQTNSTSRWRVVSPKAPGGRGVGRAVDDAGGPRRLAGAAPGGGALVPVLKARARNMCSTSVATSASTRCSSPSTALPSRRSMAQPPDSISPAARRPRGLRLRLRQADAMRCPSPIRASTMCSRGTRSFTARWAMSAATSPRSGAS
jgi:hypothetical protein